MKEGGKIVGSEAPQEKEKKMEERKIEEEKGKEKMIELPDEGKSSKDNEMQTEGNEGFVLTETIPTIQNEEIKNVENEEWI